jgi:hypothetical protein
MQPDNGIEVHQTPMSLSLSWDNRVVRKDRLLTWFLVLFWIIWAPATFLVSALAVNAKGAELLFFLVWLVFAWSGTILIPYILLMRRWRESVVVDTAAIAMNFSGPLAKRARTLPLDSVVEISFGRLSEESIVTLNIMLSQSVPFWSRRQMLGYWLSAELKEQLFEAIKAFVETHGLNVCMTRFSSS